MHRCIIDVMDHYIIVFYHFHIEYCRKLLLKYNLWQNPRQNWQNHVKRVFLQNVLQLIFFCIFEHKCQNLPLAWPVLTINSKHFRNFRLCWREIAVKCGKVYKHFVQDCSAISQSKPWHCLIFCEKRFKKTLQVNNHFTFRFN